MIESGAARSDEYPRVRDILARAFSTPDEADLWDYLVDHDPDLTPECVRVARLEGRIIACTVVLPRSIRSRIGLVHGAIVTTLSSVVVAGCPTVSLCRADSCLVCATPLRVAVPTVANSPRITISTDFTVHPGGGGTVAGRYWPVLPATV
jgi:hypothetical protein